MKSIYVDHAATSPTHPAVVEAMLPYFYESFGNPSSIHQFGRKTRQAIDEARAFLASTIRATEKEIIFTSGGTEADNLAMIGYASANKKKGKHIITTAIEHHALLHTCQHLEKKGFEVTYLKVAENGMISIEDLKSAVREDTILVSIMYGNNEVGTIQPILEIGQFLQEREVAFHTDAVQAYGIEEIDVKKMHIDFLSVSAHKINGPKGVGFLYAKNGKQIFANVFGGDQERKRRAGTENVPGIVGMKEAAKIAFAERATKREQYIAFRNRMLAIFEEHELVYKINGDENDFLPHILNVSFQGIGVESLLVNLDLAGIAASSGSACTAGSLEPSHVLAAMFENDKERIMSAVRFSFGLGNTIEEIERVAEETAKIIHRIKQ
ncbi:cysteine desulfurase family protein [Anaerobacillus isosaccharinicus]|uniref:cysteine desulfurase n=1 Tax=Anaerobacillus isosaccharinicus TaxID=1532552 RepID=A0A1S2LGA1_9BACI|nr:cysteine desulfurase family protein [Anaerobacillus isosaccharinicus]MBA5585385.1 cysteine desulfurase [Anaerobacillus isosaccharinicus]QOY36295.1 cysteine desulfurase [Anaerobacillus isosaccharinicus]